MAFKLKSGNKVSFKKMGSSPVKQTTDYTAELTGGEDIKKRTEAMMLEKNYAESQRQAKREAISNMPTKEEQRQQNIEEERRSRDITIPVATDDGVREMVVKGKELVEGKDYKTKETLKQEKKTRNYKRKQAKKDVKKYAKDLSKEDREKMGLTKKNIRKANKEQKRADKTKTLEDRAKRERGTGESRATFDWKKAVVGGSSAAGVGHEAKYKSTEKRIAKRKEKQETKKVRKEGQKERGGSAFSKAKKKIGGIFKKK